MVDVVRESKAISLHFVSLLGLWLMCVACAFNATAQSQDIFAPATKDVVEKVELFEFNTPQQQKTAIELAKSLRCPQCQNQNLVESNSPIAKDLRLIVFQKINQGESEQQVIDFMTARYGEFVRYKPAFSLKNGLLWGLPILVFLGFFFFSIRHVRRS